MAISTMYGIPQIISFKCYSMGGPLVCSYRFTKYVVFPQSGSQRVKSFPNTWFGFERKC